jgi:hypothetical protein
MGFGVPVAELIRGGMWRDVEARIRSIASAPMFARADLTKIHDVHAIWRIYALSRWAEEFGVAL